MPAGLLLTMHDLFLAESWLVEGALRVAHHAALLPAIYLAASRRLAPAAYWITALAFLVSWFADTFAWATGGSWAAVPEYQVVQWTFFALALTATGRRGVAPAIILYVVVGTALYLPMMRYASPDTYAAFMVWWWPYQSARLVSFASFVHSARRLA